MSLSSMTMSRKIVLSRTYVPIVLLVLSCLLLLRLVIRWDFGGDGDIFKHVHFIFLVFSLSDNVCFVDLETLYTQEWRSPKPRARKCSPAEFRMKLLNPR